MDFDIQKPTELFGGPAGHHQPKGYAPGRARKPAKNDTNVRDKLFRILSIQKV